MKNSIADLSKSQRAAGQSTAHIPEPPRHWKTRVLLPGVLFAVVLGLLLVTSAQALLPATPVQVVPVVVKSVQGRAGSVTVQAPGWVEPDPYTHFVAALTEGVVEDVHVLEGSPVEAGQTVVSLVADDAKLALVRAEAEVLRRASELRAAEADLAATQMLFSELIEPTRALAAAEAGLAKVKAERARVNADIAVERAKLAEKQDELTRKAQLVDSEAVSEAVVVRLQLQVEAQQAIIDATEAHGDVLDAQQRAAEAELAAARSHYDLLIEETRAVALAEAAVGTARAAVQLAEAVRDEAALRLDRMSVRTPVAGIVLKRLVSPGSKLTLNTTEHSMHVIHVYDPAKLQVRVDVPLADAANVAVGQRAEITVEVLPDRVFDGVITRIVHEADIQKNTVEVKVAIEAPSSELKPEMLARVRFLATPTAASPSASGSDGPLRQRVFAPEELILTNAGGEASTLVVSSLVDERGRVEERILTLGSTRINDWIEIESGLQPGDLLITDPRGQGGVSVGDRVRVTFFDHARKGA